MSDFLDNLNASLDEGIKSYRNDRAANPHLDDGQFVHQFGNELAAMVNMGLATPENAAFTAAAAIHRLATHECRRDGATCHD